LKWRGREWDLPREEEEKEKKKRERAPNLRDCVVEGSFEGILI
jgi:hypothetical protein